MEDQSPLEGARAKKFHELYDRLHEVLGEKFTYERFSGWVGQYLRESREFHGPNHMLAMSQLSKEIPPKAAVYSMVAGFLHDEDYPSIGEPLTYMSKRFIDKYIENRDGKQFVKPLEANDRIGKILHEVFGFNAGQQLSPFPFGSNPGGMNEFYSAAAAAGELKELGKDEKFIAAVVAGIEATVPFRKPTRMNELRSRVEKTNDDLALGFTTAELDEVMTAAVHTANRDVVSFLGGLDASDTTAVPSTLSVVATIRGGDMLSPEEIKELRMKGYPDDKQPGEYSPRKFLDARLKRAGLYHLVIPGDINERTISNLFFNTTLSDGTKYPQNGWADNANKLAFENNQPVQIAEYARLVSAGLVSSIVELSAPQPEQVMVKDVLKDIDTRIKPKLPVDASQTRRLAFSCLCGRDKSGGHDIRRSPIAELILSKLDEKKVQEFGKAARSLLLPGPLSELQIKELQTDHPNVYTHGTGKPEMFLRLATEYLGTDVEKIRGEIEHSTRSSSNHVLAESIHKIQLPPVRQL